MSSCPLDRLKGLRRAAALVDRHIQALGGKEPLFRGHHKGCEFTLHLPVQAQ
jgi:hypothetical protein